MAALALHLPAAALAPAVWPFALLIGAVAAWRYGWSLVHLVRALVYRRLVFPRRRAGLSRLVEDAQENEADRAALFPELVALLPIGREPAETTAAVLRSLIEQAKGYPRPLTIVATPGEIGDERFVRRLFQEASPPDRVRLVLVAPRHPGPRAALAAGLIAVSRLRPPPQALLLLLDPRAVLLPGTLERTVPFLALRPELGFVTTDQDAAPTGSGPFSAWRALRLARRQLLCSSFALGDRAPPGEDGLLILPIGLATRPDLLALVRDEGPGGPRPDGSEASVGAHGTIWRWLVGQGLAGLHVPDVRVLLIERAPERGFLRASAALLQVETGGLASAFRGLWDPDPMRLGPLLWGYLVDQRLGAALDLLAPVAALLAAVAVGPGVLLAYLLWLMCLWLIEALVLLSVRPRPEILAPLLVGYDRLWAPIVRSRVRPSAGRPAMPGDTPRKVGLAARAEAAWADGLAILTLLAAAGFATGALTLPHLPVLGRTF